MPVRIPGRDVTLYRIVLHMTPIIIYSLTSFHIED